MTDVRGANDALDVVCGAIVRLDQRGAYLLPARVELQRGTTADGGWVAQLLADPLRHPVVGWGATNDEALLDLAREVEHIDWRRVRRR